MVAELLEEDVAARREQRLEGPRQRRRPRAAEELGSVVDDGPRRVLHHKGNVGRAGAAARDGAGDAARWAVRPFDLLAEGERRLGLASLRRLGRLRRPPRRAVEEGEQPLNRRAEAAAALAKAKGADDVGGGARTHRRRLQRGVQHGDDGGVAGDGERLPLQSLARVAHLLVDDERADAERVQPFLRIVVEQLLRAVGFARLAARKVEDRDDAPRRAERAAARRRGGRERVVGAAAHEIAELGVQLRDQHVARRRRLRRRAQQLRLERAADAGGGERRAEAVGRRRLPQRLAERRHAEPRRRLGQPYASRLLGASVVERRVAQREDAEEGAHQVRLLARRHADAAGAERLRKRGEVGRRPPLAVGARRLRV